MSDEQEIDRLCREAWSLPNGPTKVSLLEQAVNVADSLNDIEQAFHLRQQLIDVANFSGRGDLLMVHFSWCLGQYDRDPERFPSYSLHWTYKWIVGDAPHFPEISRKQIEQLLADLRRRYLEVGGSLFAYWQLRRDVMVEMGDVAEAKAAQRHLQRTKRGYLSDCPACVASSNAEFYLFTNRPALAFRVLQPLFDRGLTCAEQPIAAVSFSLPHLFRAGRTEQARELQRHYAKEFRKHARVTKWVAHHVEFLTLDDNLAAATRLVDRHLEAAVNEINLQNRFLFFRAARMLTLRLHELGKSQIKLRAPSSVTLPPTDDVNSAWAEWFFEQASEIGRRFDERNGNNLFAKLLERFV